MYQFCCERVAPSITDGFVQHRIDIAQSSQVDNRPKAKRFPDLGKHHRPGEDLVIPQEEDRPQADPFQTLVDDALGGRKDIHQDARHDNPGKEVRQVDDRLDRTLEGAVEDVVEHQRHGHRHDHAKCSL